MGRNFWIPNMWKRKKCISCNLGVSAAVLTKAAIFPFLCNASNADFIRHKLSLQIKILLLRPFFSALCFSGKLHFLDRQVVLFVCPLLPDVRLL